MSHEWRRNAEAALVDLNAAALSLDDNEALGHLRDAVANLNAAIEKLEGE